MAVILSKNDHDFLERHMEEFRNQVLAKLDNDEVLLILHDYEGFGGIMFDKFIAWRMEHDNEERIAKMEARQGR